MVHGTVHACITHHPVRNHIIISTAVLYNERIVFLPIPGTVLHLHVQTKLVPSILGQLVNGLQANPVVSRLITLFNEQFIPSSFKEEWYSKILLYQNIAGSWYKKNTIIIQFNSKKLIHLLLYKVRQHNPVRYIVIRKPKAIQWNTDMASSVKPACRRECKLT